MKQGYLRFAISLYATASLASLSYAEHAQRIVGVDGMTDGLVINFEVFDVDQKKVFYSGHETIAIKEGVITKTTHYFRPDSLTEPVQIEVSVYDRHSLKPNQFEFENKLTGERTSFSGSAGKVMISHVAGHDKDKEKGEVEWGSSSLFGKALHHVIVRNWERLLAGERKRFDILVASRLASYRFQIIRHRSEETSRGAMEVIRLEPQSWLVRRFVESMDFYYLDSEFGPLLKKYRGPTTIAIDGDSGVEVVIVFEYQFPKAYELNE